MGICDTSVEHKHMKVNWGQSVHLSCAIHTNDVGSILEAQGPIKWYYFRSEKSSGFEVFPKREKYVQTSDHGLVILGVTDREIGRYDCRLGASTIFSYSVQVDQSKCFSYTFSAETLANFILFSFHAETCPTPNEAHEFQKIYSDWCHEFEKYKSAMKSWQMRQSVRINGGFICSCSNGSFLFFEQKCQIKHNQVKR